MALSNNRIVRVAEDQVTFRYTVSESGRTAYCTLPAQEFLHRFLQQILPKGLVNAFELVVNVMGRRAQVPNCFCGAVFVRGLATMTWETGLGG